MDRRKTILIAVLVNAGLLVVLFIMALGYEEETPIKNDEIPQMAMQERGPLFPEFQEGDENSVLAVEESKEPVLVQTPQVAAQPVHQLPPIATVQEPSPTTSAQVAIRTAPTQSVCAEITVKKGDTLEKIARLHHTNIDEIVRLNQLSSSFLRIGQILKIPSAPAAPKSLAAAEKRPVAPAAQQEYYTVKVGDNPWTIAMKHHLKVDELLKLNELNEEKARRLRPGDRLRIR